MQPVTFKECNLRLTPPSDTAIDVVAIDAFRDGNEVITCWEPSQEEREAIANGASVWLRILGRSMPPAHVGAKSPFEEGEACETSESERA